MIRTALAACPGCARHVRVNEPVCPFCGAALPSSFRQLQPRPSPAKRLSRAALHALGVGALSATAAACGSPFTSEDGLAVPYGLPPLATDADTPMEADIDDANARLESAAPVDAGVVLDAGVDDAHLRRDSAVAADANETQDASVEDASTSPDSAAPIDAHVEDHISIRPLYGGPIIVGQ